MVACRAHRPDPRQLRLPWIVLHLPAVELEPEEVDLTDEELLAHRPRVRGDCVNGQRPCPWLLCRHNLLCHVDPRGRLRLAPGVREGDLPVDRPSCSLDVADQGPQTLNTVWRAMHSWKGEIRLAQCHGLAKMRAALSD